MPVASFKKPPVGEVSFGLWFQPLPAFKTAHYGAYWDLIRKDYPECEDKPPVLDANPLGFRQVGDWFPPPRVWYLHRDRNLLIQLQPNRIWLNWRRISDGDEYPRFEALLPVFRATVQQFAEFLRANNVGSVLPHGGELSYVNQFPPGDQSQPYSDIGEVLKDVSWSAGHKVLPNPDGIAWRAEFTVDGDRLSVDLKTGKRSDTQQNLHVLEIRAFTGTSSTFDIDSWFPKANTLVVGAFCDLTTERAQRELWQRVD